MVITHDDLLIILRTALMLRQQGYPEDFLPPQDFLSRFLEIDEAITKEGIGKDGTASIVEMTIEVLQGFLDPVPMLLFCPGCSMQHIDEPDPVPARSLTPQEKHDLWTNPPHRTHKCKHCGRLWRPSDRFTTGVKELSSRGSKDGSPFPNRPEACRAGKWSGGDGGHIMDCGFPECGCDPTATNLLALGYVPAAGDIEALLTWYERNETAMLPLACVALIEGFKKYKKGQ